jgi:acyl-coenzyme A thioesterase PaaI-like protein
MLSRVSTETQRFPFSEVTAITPSREHGRFTADVHPEWTIAGKPNGGYLLAMLGRAAASMSSHGDPIAASATYLRAPDPGPVAIDTELLREGRSTSQIRTRLTQGDQICVEAIVTVSELQPDVTPDWDHGLPPEPERTPFAECVRLLPVPGAPVRVALQEQVEVRLEPRSTGFLSGQPAGSGELAGWLALLDGKDFDPISLLFAVDAFPPGTLDIHMSGWVPTLELSAYVRALPAPGPVRVLQKALLIEAHRVDELCYVWDSTGRLVAQASQLAGIRLP